MGKLDQLLGRKFNISKLKTFLNLAISRLAVLKNHRQARLNLARSDIVQILSIGHHDRALLRVEQVIKEQNMLDVFVMIESYCNLSTERINLLKQEKVCPEELREAVSGLLYASTRCGEFPELIELRAIFTSRFGKEFAARAIELRNNCGVHPKMIQKLSTRQPTLENRLKVLKEIAAENSIDLKFEEDYSIAAEENVKKEQNKHPSKPEVPENLGGSKIGYGLRDFTENIKNMEELSDSIKVKRKYKDVADAAQAAFESAAYAAAAARIAVELSKSDYHDHDNQNNPSSGNRRVRDKIDTTEYITQTTKQSSLNTITDQNASRGSAKNDFMQKYDSESEDEEIQFNNGTGESVGLSSNSKEDVMEKGINFDKSDDEKENGEGEVLLSKTNNLGLDLKSNVFMKEDTESMNFDTEQERSQKRFPLRSEARAKTDARTENFEPNFKKEINLKNTQLLEEKRPVSVRTRLRGWKH